MIYLVADHRGFELKEALKAHLNERGIAFEDLGAAAYDQSDDYVDFAARAAGLVAANPSVHKGIFLCGSGHGVDIVANKFKGIRVALCWNEDVAKQSREHDNANVLVLPSDWLTEEQVRGIVEVWLKTAFSGEERHQRRLEKIRNIEKKNFF